MKLKLDVWCAQKITGICNQTEIYTYEYNLVPKATHNLGTHETTEGIVTKKTTYRENCYTVKQLQNSSLPHSIEKKIWALKFYNRDM